MLKMKKIGFSIIVGLLLSIVMLHFSGDIVKATTVPLPEEYYFVMSGQHKVDGDNYELKVPKLLISVTSGAWEPTTTVGWISSDPGVVDIEYTANKTQINLLRKGPGYATITATLSLGSSSYSVNCIIKVDLAFDYQKTGLTAATTTNERVLIINGIPQTKPVYLKYIDYDTEGVPVTVSGAAISGSAVTWESDNRGVATVSDTGVITSVGAGSANITVTTNTLSSIDKPLTTSLMVVVKPEFKLSYDDAAMQHFDVDSIEKKADLINPALGVPSNFVIESTATIADNLTWKVYESSKPDIEIKPTGSSKMTYSVSTLSKTVTFSNVKAGTYEIYAFANEDFNVGTKVPYAYMKIVVPIDVGDKNVVMTVGDSYSILENSNIPGLNIFLYTPVEGDYSIAELVQSTGIITAKRKGFVRLKMDYQSDKGLFDGDISDIFINVTVIDGIALSTTNATMYTSGTLLLHAIVTDSMLPVWSTSDSNIATVVDGLVTAKKAGRVIITAKQTVNGIVKKATCVIMVQPTVSTITVDPSKITLPIKGYKTLHAIIAPLNLSGISLTWKSSNTDIVKVIEYDALTATVQGVAGGHAVISAINQDNVVVGYCHVSVQQSVTSIVLSEAEITLDLLTKRVQLRAIVYPESALNQKVNWSTTDETKARVDQNGLVTILKPGTVTIIASSDDNPVATAFCNLNIQIPVVSITLDETVKTMYKGQTARLAYVILPNNASNNAVTWLSTNAAVATVDATGKVSAKNTGTTVIILKTLEGGFSVYCTLTVRSVATGIKLDVSELELKTGEVYYIKPTLTPKDSTDNELVWESSDPKVATIDNNGKISAKAAGTTIIMARTEAGATAYCKLKVKRTVDGILLNFSEKTVFIGNEFKLKVSVSPSDASEWGVTWKSSNTKVATVSEDGIVEGLVGGTALITCTTIDGGFSAICAISVREPMTKITLNHESYKLGIEKTVMLIATITTETATNPDITWSSSNKKVALVNQKGKVTGISAGYSTITAIAQDGSEVEASCDIRVVTPITGITLNKSVLWMLTGESRTLKATIRPSKATYKNAKWTSSDDTVAFVDEDGVITALKAGNATITAEAQDNTGKRAVCFVTVGERVAATGITLMDKKLVMVQGEEKAIQIVLNPITSTDGYSWSTDNSSVARVDKNTGRITAKATGTANITVMTDSGKTAVIEVTVIGLNVTELTLEQYTDYILYVEGATSAIRWDVSNPQIAEVTGGTVSSKAIGTATITATVNGRRLICKLKVTKIK